MGKGMLAWAVALGLGFGPWSPAQAQRRPAREARGDVNLMLKGGVGDYTGGLSSLTAAGPSWGVVLNVQPWNMLGYEVAYDGSRNLLADERISEASALTRHGVSGLVKLSPPLLRRIKPFVGAGFGASMIQVTEHEEDLYRGDLVQELPLAAGLEFNTQSVTAGLRTTYRWLVDESFAAGAAPGNPQGGYLDAGVTVGGRF
jgi:hypothetical protein